MKRITAFLFLIMMLMFACRTPQETTKIISKAEWGGAPGDSSKMKLHQIQKITIHHEGIEDDGSKTGAQKMRNLQHFSLNDKPWGDIPYHYVIDLKGNVYEGRDVKYAGDTNTSYDPTGHLLICVDGNYEVQELLPETYNALVKLTAEMAEKYSISLDDIKTHRDYTSETVCPGKNLYAKFTSGDFYRDVEKMMKTK